MPLTPQQLRAKYKPVLKAKVLDKYHNYRYANGVGATFTQGMKTFIGTNIEVIPMDGTTEWYYIVNNNVDRWRYTFHQSWLDFTL